MTKTFTFESDWARGWLLVSLADLIDVGLAEKDITPYSYVSPDGVIALEEDLDAQIFLNVWQAKHKTAPSYDERSVATTAIRTWRSFGTRGASHVA